ncbi:IS110 family transposase [Leifsonia sp. McL0607]|uniref:IS110 family transposase n=1 Tax=Leifsonia sp. McL0607 TaxID=3415672 RepID=UPI003CED2728
MPQLWAGIDAGKGHHHCVVIDEEGQRLFSRRVANNEGEILDLLSDVVTLAGDREICWATDLNRGGASLLISILTDHGQPLLYIPGRTVHHAARTYRGDGKTDAKDAAIIADQARMRRDLHPIRVGDEISIELRLLTAHRVDLVCDRTRTINRLRAVLLEFFPGLEAAFDYASTKSALLLLTRYQTPDAIRRMGQTRLTTWLKKQGCRKPGKLAASAVAVAKHQRSTVPGQATSAMIVQRLAADILRLHREIAEIERQIETRFREHHTAELILSIPGFGPLLGADVVAATGGDVAAYGSADRLAGVAGLAPAPRDSGKISGNHSRPRRYDRRLLRACYLAAQTAAWSCPVSRAFYERKRIEGKTHKQAVLALARRRINVLWAIHRSGQPFDPAHGSQPMLAAA